MTKKNDVFQFACWFWGLLGKAGSPQPADPEFRRILGQAKNLQREGYDLDRVRRVLKAMTQSKIVVTTPFAVRWRAPDKIRTWYEYAVPKPPPIYDRMNYELHERGELPYRVA